MYLIDTNVISEARKGSEADAGVLAFFKRVVDTDAAVYLSCVTVGELRRGVELVRHRGDQPQADLLERWLAGVLQHPGHHILPLDDDAAQVWGRLRVPQHEHAIDKQIAAIALVNDLTVVTRNTAHFQATGVRLLNPFAIDAA